MAALSLSVMFAGKCAGPITPNQAVELETFHDLANRGQVGKRRLPLRGRDTIGSELAGADLRRPRDKTDEHHVDLAAEHIGERRRGSL